MQLAADVAEPLDQGALDVRVNVFELDGERELAALDLAGDVVEGGDDLLGLVGGEQADLGEHAGVGLAGADVVAVEPAVEADRLGEGLDAVVGVAAESAAPGFLAHGVSRRCRDADSGARDADACLLEHCVAANGYSPSSFNCFASTGAGAPVIRSRAFWFFGKAITSRMFVVPASIIAQRSRPRAMPPCGGAPNFSASSRKPNRSLGLLRRHAQHARTAAPAPPGCEYECCRRRTS